MNRKMFLSALAALVVVSASGACYAQDVVMENKPQPPIERPQGKWGTIPEHKFKHEKPSKAEMEAKKAEFEKRLNLTEKQKEEIEKNKQKDRENMKALYDEMNAKKAEIRNIKMNNSLSDEEKVKKSAKIEKDLIDLKVKANDLRKKNMENFENMLTKEQKAEFSKIKEEQKREMEKRRSQFKHHRGHKMPKPPIGLPVEPKPMPIAK